jgi:hypothetical protein
VPIRLLILACALVVVFAGPAAAQDVQRTIDQYDTEIGVKYVYLHEEGGYAGTPGVLVEGGYRVWRRQDWRLQAIAEAMLVRVGDYDATYKQVAAGARLGRLFSPKLRVFGQFQLGVQNDGFEDSNTGLVIVPGGGATYALTERFDAQAMIDFPAVRYSGRTFNQFRLAVGVSLPLGAH